MVCSRELLESSATWQVKSMDVSSISVPCLFVSYKNLNESQANAHVVCMCTITNETLMEQNHCFLGKCIWTVRFYLSHILEKKALQKVPVLWRHGFDEPRQSLRCVQVLLSPSKYCCLLTLLFPSANFL